jgi:GDP-mannose 6-dehydrogenase
MLTGDAEDVLAHAEICIVGSTDPQVLDAVAATTPEQIVVDLVHLPDAAARHGDPTYVGLSW